MMLQIGILVICGALPGLLFRRFGPWPARLGALFALAAIGFGLLDLQRETLTREPAVLAVVPTGPWSAEATAALTKRWLGDAGTAVVRVEEGARPVAERLARARLRGSEEPHPVLLWNGGTGATGRGGRAGSGGAATSAAEPGASKRPAQSPGIPGRLLSDGRVTPFDPDQVRVRALNPLAAGRPGALAIELPPIAQAGETQVTVTITDPSGAVVLEHRAPGAPYARVEWAPAAAGRHRLVLELEHQGVRFAGRGELQVRPAPKVLVVGGRAQNMVRALEAQGLAAEASATLPASLEGTVVALDPLSTADQSRIAAFVRDGGGVLLVGGARGGAVPGPGEPLAGLCPVIRLPLPEKAPEGPGPGGGPPPVKPPRADPPPKQPKDPPPTQPPPGQDEPPKQPPEGAQGETRGARETGTEREVARRSIAMVLLIDGSGSMDEFVKVGVKRIDVARSSALQTALALDEDDEIGVVSFGERNGARIELPMTPVKRTAAIRTALSGLHARAWDTRVRHGLQRARKLLEASKAAVKYVIVVTDGVITDVGAAATHSEARKCGAAGITIVVVQVLSPGSHGAFDAASQTQALVQRANGQLVQQRDFDSVPKVISSEVERVRGVAGRPRRKPANTPDPKGPDPAKKPAGEERPETPPAKPEETEKPPGPDKPPDKPPEGQPEKPPTQSETSEPPPQLRVHVVEDASILEPRPASGQFPPVGGILPVRGREDARTLLAAGPDGLPLLALANRGLGRVGVWTADFFGPWGEPWASHPGFPGWVAQWVAALAPPIRTASSAPLLAGAVPLQEVLVPRVQAQLESLVGSPLGPVESLVLPPPKIRTEVEGAAADHAWYGVLFLLLLVGIEFLSLRRRRGGADQHAHR